MLKYMGGTQAATDCQLGLPLTAPSGGWLHQLASNSNITIQQWQQTFNEFLSNFFTIYFIIYWVILCSYQFMDVQMPEMGGFEVLRELQQLPVVIFVTAYDQYAVKAFKVPGLSAQTLYRRTFL